jgi:hypothetical protein
MIRTFDPNILRKAAEPYPEILEPEFDFEGWVANTQNIVLVEDEDVGFFTYEYAGVFTPHYFLKSRGKAAIDVTLRAFKKMFEEYGCKTLRGITKTELKAARWMARQYGFKSYGFIECLGGEHEMLIMTKEEFYDHLDRKKNG